eukprot:gene7560-8846_t
MSAIIPSCQPYFYGAITHDPKVDAEVLRKAMKGIGTDESALIKVIANRCWEEKRAIIAEFHSKFGKDLIKEIKSEVSGNFETALVALLTEPANYDYDCLLDAMKGLGTNENTLIEILVTRGNAQTAKLTELFHTRQSKSLEAWIKSETSGDFKKVCEYLLEHRDETGVVDPALAVADAKTLYGAGEGKIGTDEKTFISILTKRNFLQLRETDRVYDATQKHSLKHAIETEFSGNVKVALLAIIAFAKNPYEYFASLLHDAMEGAGTNDKKLIRVIVSQQHYIEPIKVAYAHKYHKSLKDAISSETSGDYKKLLLDLINA